jgi:CRISPR-associated endonuclease Csn1
LHKETISGSVTIRFKKTVPLSTALDSWQMIVDKPLKKQISEFVALGYDKNELEKYFKDRKNKWNEKDVSKVEIYYLDNDYVASRVMLDTSFNAKKIERITDTAIQKILLNHLSQEKYQNQKNEKGKSIAPELLAFSPEGIDEMNKNIVELNYGKPHKRIYKVRTYEAKGNKFAIGTVGAKKNKFVETAQGTNLFFAIYVNENGNRGYETIPLNIVIERLKQGLKEVPDTNGAGSFLLFHLSPNDLVYVPTAEEIENPINVNFEKLTKEQVERIYKVEKFTGASCYFIRNDIAKLIKQYDPETKFGELESQNKLVTTMCENKIKIQDVCWKLKVNSLGKIKKISYD